MNVKANLFTGKPIIIPRLGVIHQPKVEMLLTTDIEFDTILMPFCVSTDALELDGQDVNDFRNFDLLFLQHFQKELQEEGEQLSLLDMLINSLKILMKTNHIEVNFEEMRVIVNESGVLDRDNFDMLVDAVFKIAHKDRPKYEKRKTKLSPKQQEIMDRLNKKREVKAKKNQEKIEDLLNVVIHGGKSFIPYDLAVDFTYWQLINSYISITTIDGYKEFLAFKSSGQFEIKDQVDHWIKQLKLK